MWRKAVTDPIIDPDFGALELEPIGWRGLYPYGEAAIALTLGTREVANDVELRDHARIALQHLASLDAKAREFVAATHNDAHLTSLEAVEFTYPHADWIRHRGPGGTPRANLFNPSRPITTLVYGLANDRNVLDVIFHGDEPCETDYH
jgi:hypothetical protein